MPKKMSQEEFADRLKEYSKDKVDLVSDYVNKRTHVRIKCKKCGYEWEISPSSLCPSSCKETSFKGCPECKYETRFCDYCGKEVKRLKTEFNTKSGYIYCSRECGNKHKNSLNKKINNGTAYRRNALEYYGNSCSVCGYEEDTDLLEVHHIDEDRTNNELNNLIVLCCMCHKKLTMGTYELVNRSCIHKK